MNKSKLISVIIPTFNRKDIISRSLNSVLNQTYKNLEIIIVDDCSTDGTESFIQDIKDSRIKYAKLEKNSGPSVARNFGIKIATGDFITFQDSDDEYLPDKIEVQYSEFEKDESLDMVFCRYSSFDSKTLVKIWEEPSEERVLELKSNKYSLEELFLKGNLSGTPTIMVKKQLLDKIGGFDENFHTLEDWEFALRIVHSSKAKFIDRSLIKVYPSTDGVNRINDIRKFNSCISILRKYWSFYNSKEVFCNLLSVINEYISMQDSVEQSQLYDILFNSIDINSGSQLSEIAKFFNNSKLLKDLTVIANTATERLEIINNLNNDINFLNETINKLNERIIFEKSKKTAILKIVEKYSSESLLEKLGSCFCIYGAGEVSRCLIPLCQKSEINIPFTIDRKPKIISNVPSFIMEEIPDKEIPIIITAYDPEKQIREELKRFTNAKIEYLEDLLNKDM